MIDRQRMHRVDVADSPEDIRRALLESPYSRLLVIRAGNIDEPLGYVHKKELFADLLQGRELDILPLLREPLSLPDSSTVLGALELMREASTHLASWSTSSAASKAC